MSVRSLYRMFADKGLVVAQYIRNRRLDFCADAIRHAADDEKTGRHWLSLGIFRPESFFNGI